VTIEFIGDDYIILSVLFLLILVYTLINNYSNTKLYTKLHSVPQINVKG